MFNPFKKTYTTPPGELLTPTPTTTPEIIPGFCFAQILNGFGVGCHCVGTCEAPQLIKYDFTLEDISTYNENKIKQAIKAIQARYNTPVMLSGSCVGDFALDVIRTNKADLFLYSGIYSRVFNSSSRSTACIGVDTQNNVVNLDVAKAPHILIAGTTGSGKSVLLNSLVCSLLYHETPATAQFIFIDPKKVELELYAGLPHLYKPIIKDVSGAVEALKMVCDEMDERYNYLARKGLKNIDQTKKPRLYVVIDELADLMLTSRKAVETYIIRIAQLGRAAGIHLIIATQRPTTNIITGLIKANIPCKIALAVSNTSDSMTILNHGGAEKLTGRGDAIIKKPDSITETRFQAFYTPDKDINRIVNYYKAG